MADSNRFEVGDGPNSRGMRAEPPAAVPRVTDHQRDHLADADTLTEALWELAEIYRVPLTNNAPFFEDGDPTRPVFHIGDWIQDLTDVFARFTHPSDEPDGPHGR